VGCAAFGGIRLGFGFVVVGLGIHGCGVGVVVVVVVEVRLVVVLVVWVLGSAVAVEKSSRLGQRKKEMRSKGKM
jgi:hypothetical protein